jgi:SAM-dependent methyltransferase
MTEPDHETSAKAAYDATADLYTELVGSEITDAIEGPLDRAVLGAFVELVGTAGPGLVADVGCGPGRVAGLLASRGLDVVGIDLSPAMLDAARAAHPGIEFREGRLTALPLPDDALVGAACWYSIINTPPEHLDDVALELARVLAPGGQLLVGFQAGGGEAVHREELHGRPVSLTSYRHDPDVVASALDAAGLIVHARASREAILDRPYESSRQAFLLGAASSA